MHTIVVGLLASYSNVVHAKRVIIDDSEIERISYSSNNWNVGNTCGGCYAHPDRARAYNGTWHE
jgi:hypothetical protein